MKKITHFLLIICLIIAVDSCQKEPFLTLNSQSSISFPEQGGSQDITFSANRDWTVSSSESWCKVSPASGTASEGVISFKVTCDQNTTYDPRSCAVTISAGGLTQTISVSQETNQGLLVSPTSYNLSNGAQTIEVEVKANVKYIIDVDSSCKDWIKHVSTRALSTNTLVFEISENESFDDRTGKITFHQTDGILAETIVVNQKPMDVRFEINPTHIDLSSVNQEFSVDISTNVDFNIIIPIEAQNWLNNESASSTSVSFMASENNTSEERSTTVEFRNKEGAILGRLGVFQDQSPLYSPLTLEAIYGGEIHINNPLFLTIEYKQNGIWNSFDEDITIIVSAGEAIQFRGDNNAYASLTSETNIYTNGEFYIYGNIMSLVNSKDFSRLSTVKERAFLGLFHGRITNHPSRELLLPATTLAKYCYANMFQHCESLTTAPALPATTLADNCYSWMFAECYSLTTAPELPATTLAKYCYANMFCNCENLTTAPNLPATVLAEGCYSGMFTSCSSLTQAPDLPAIQLAPNCYFDMFRNTSLSSAPSLPAEVLSENCYASMFYGCHKLTSAPDLPAKYLRTRCYDHMFYDCINLNSVKALFISKPSGSYTDNWLAGVSSNGTFVKNISAQWDVRGESGVPEGWDIDYIDLGLPEVHFDNSVNFGKIGSYIDIEKLLFQYSRFKSIFLDIYSAQCDLGGRRQRLPRTIILTQTEPGVEETFDPVDGAPVPLPKNKFGFLTYRNNRTNVFEDFNIFMTATLYYENGDSITVELVIPVIKTSDN